MATKFFSIHIISAMLLLACNVYGQFQYRRTENKPGDVISLDGVEFVQADFASIVRLGLGGVGGRPIFRSSLLSLSPCDACCRQWEILGLHD